MLYKTDELKNQFCYKRLVVEVNDGPEIIWLRPMLIEVLNNLDDFIGFSLTGKITQITITCLIDARYNDDGTPRFSLHPFGYAADVRTRDWPHSLKQAIKVYGMALNKINPTVQFVWEDNAPGGPHLHIEIDDENKAVLKRKFYEKQAWFFNPPDKEKT